MVNDVHACMDVLMPMCASESKKTVSNLLFRSHFFMKVLKE